MAEPITTSSATGAAMSVGLMALLVGWIGQVGADVMMVVLASFAGTAIALSSNESNTVKEAVKLLTIGLIISLAVAWSVASFVAAHIPSLDSAYLPSTIALMISFGSNRIAKWLNALLDKAEEKAGIK
jgi:hypothetical protein